MHPSSGPRAMRLRFVQVAGVEYLRPVVHYFLQKDEPSVNIIGGVILEQVIVGSGVDLLPDMSTADEVQIVQQVLDKLEGPND